MIAKAKSRYIRISPRKFRQIIPLVKGKRVEEAIALLSSVNKRASVYAIEVLKSALNNAKKLHEDIETSNIYISKMIADCGPILKRFRAASMGRAVMIKKRMSHITVELDELKGPVSAQGSAKKKAKKMGTKISGTQEGAPAKEKRGAKLLKR